MSGYYSRKGEEKKRIRILQDASYKGRDSPYLYTLRTGQRTGCFFRCSRFSRTLNPWRQWRNFMHKAGFMNQS